MLCAAVIYIGGRMQTMKQVTTTLTRGKSSIYAIKKNIDVLPAKESLEISWFQRHLDSAQKTTAIQCDRAQKRHMELGKNDGS